MKAAHVFVRGRVQGVSYRNFVESQAEELGIGGWVRNRSDGSVEAWLEGDRDNVANLMELMEEGPEGAGVNDVEVSWEEPEGFAGFERRPTK